MSGRIRAVKALLLGLDRNRIVGAASLTVDDALPDVLIVDGEPFIRFDWPGATPVYAQTRPYRVDPGLLEVAP